MKRIATLCAASCVVVAVAAACGQSESTATREAGTETATASPTAAPTPNGPTITIEGMGFSEGLTVAPGAQITIVNNDEVEHSVTARDEELFDVHVDGKQRATLTAPAEPGEYAFYCVYHPSMKGTLIVT